MCLIPKNNFLNKNTELVFKKDLSHIVCAALNRESFKKLHKRMHTNAYIIFQEKNENKLVNISSTLTLVVEVVAQVQLLNHF